jgi:hypothetical protein
MFGENSIDVIGIHSAVTFLEVSIWMCPGNSAYRMYVTGCGRVL